jgi:hypothetical protein
VKPDGQCPDRFELVQRFLMRACILVDGGVSCPANAVEELVNLSSGDSSVDEPTKQIDLVLLG